MDLFVALQKVVPQTFITVLAGCLAECRWSPLKNLLIRIFSKAYGVDMSEAKALSITQYESFNDFFTRELKTGVRAIDLASCSVVSPADGAISEVGEIQHGKLLQAKGVHYSAANLLASSELADELEGGTFATIYLSPKDYHRIHMPFAGDCQKMTYVPGKLFSVNQRTAAHLDSLFARNERLVATFTQGDQRFAMVMVGAMIVGGMETVLTGKLKRGKDIVDLPFEQKPLRKGEEFGRFYLGSTAIILFPKTMGLDLLPRWQSGEKVQMGDKLAEASL